MPCRIVFRPRILRRIASSVSSLRCLNRRLLCTSPALAESSPDRVLQTSPPIAKQIPLARHSDLLATAGTEDDVTGIELRIAGLVRSIRKQKKVAFAHISDGSTLQPVQAILTPKLADGITNGSYVELVGTWTASPADGQANELQVIAVNYVGETKPDDFPIQKKSMSTDFLRSVPHLRFRTPFYALLARSRSRLSRSIGQYYNYSRTNEAFQVQPPLITSSDCEGAGEVFTLSPKSSKTTSGASLPPDTEDSKLYFRDHKYLTVSSQLHLEAYSAELGDVWALSPTFRAEESDTPRHLSEFYMLEAEFRSITSLTGLLKEVEDLIRFLVTSFRTDGVGKQLLAYYANPNYHSDALAQDKVDLEDRWYKIDGRPWTTMTYADAITALESKPINHFNFPPSWQGGLQLEHERWLVENIGHNSPVFVTDYPQHLKPFYMLPSTVATDARSRLSTSSQGDHPEDLHADTVACFDLLFPYGTAEIVGGSLREHRLPNLISSMREKGLVKRVVDNKNDSKTDHSTYPYLSPDETLGTLQWYADLRRYGSSPHGGFGMGFDRLLAYLTGTASVRETVGFPRWFGRADC